MMVGINVTLSNTVSMRDSLRNATRWYLMIIVLSLLFCSAVAANTHNRHVKIGVSLRPVYVHMDENGEVYGTDIDRAKAIFSHANFDVSFYVFPWKRILYLIEHGQLDVALSASNSAERRVFAHFTNEPFRLGHNVLFTKIANKSRFSQLSGLTEIINMNTRLAVLRGVAYSKEYEALMYNPDFTRKLVIIDSPERLIDTLMLGRSDAFLGSEHDILNEIHKRDLSQEIVPALYLMSDREAASYIMFSKQTIPDEWVAQIDQAIRALRANGKIPLNPRIDTP